MNVNGINVKPLNDITGFNILIANCLMSVTYKNKYIVNIINKSIENKILKVIKLVF